MTQIARADELKNQLQLGNSLPLILKAVPEATPTLTPTIMPSITATPTPTATFTPTPTPTLDVTVKPMGNVVITYIFFDGSGSDEPDEYVEIRNDDVGPILLHDWTLRDDADRIFTFPERVIFPAQVCRIYTNEDHPESCGFNYGSGSAIWNNSGDCAYLRDASSALVDDYCY